MFYHLTILIFFFHHRRLVCAFMRMHAYAHPKVVSERKKRARYTGEKSSTNRLSTKCLVTAKCVRAPLGRNQKNVMKKLTDWIHHCLLNVSPFPSASSRALHNEETKNRRAFRDTKPNVFSLLERVGSVVRVLFSTSHPRARFLLLRARR